MLKKNIFISMYMWGMIFIPIKLSKILDLDWGESIFILLCFGLMVGGILGFIDSNYVKKTDSKTDAENI